MNSTVKGNHLKEEVTLTGSTTVAGGLWARANFVSQGNTCHFAGGNVSGVEWDGVPIDPAALPQGVTVGPGVNLHPEFVLEHPEPLAVAAAIVREIEATSGANGLAAWLWDVEYILGAAADLSYATWVAAHAVWADSVTNTTYSLASFKRIAAFLIEKPVADVELADWPALRDLLRTQTLATWAGEETQTVSDE